MILVLPVSISPIINNSSKLLTKPDVVRANFKRYIDLIVMFESEKEIDLAKFSRNYAKFSDILELQIRYQAFNKFSLLQRLVFHRVSYPQTAQSSAL